MNTSALESLADPRRAAILELLADGERCLCEVSAALGISDALASHHVKRLRGSGLVVAERRGVWLHCRLAPDTLSQLAAEIEGLAARARDARPAVTTCCARPARGQA